MNLLEHIKYDWKMLVINDEIQLMNKYAEYGRLFAMYYILCDYPGLVAFIVLQFVPAILDVFFPLDEPRPHRYPFEAEYFINDEKYFYPILTHMIILIIIVFTISASSDLLYITLIMHGCGALNVLGYRLEHMFDDVSITDRNETNKDEWDKFSARIKEYVKCHCRIIQYIENLNSVYAASYFLQFVLVILILTGLLIRVFDALSSLKDLDHVIFCSLHAFGLYFITFMNILPAQMLLDYGEDVFYKLYFARWYMIPFRIQKSILFMMHSCQKPYSLNVLNITISLQIFAVMIQTSVSYFTVLYSLRN